MRISDVAGQHSSEVAGSSLMHLYLGLVDVGVSTKVGETPWRGHGRLIKVGGLDAISGISQ